MQSETRAANAGATTVRVRSRLAGGGRWIRTLSVPRVMDGDLGRQVSALIAVFKLAGTAVTSQRGTKVIGPDRHPEFT